MAWAIFGVVVALAFMAMGTYQAKNGIGRNRNRNRNRDGY